MTKRGTKVDAAIEGFRKIKAQFPNGLSSTAEPSRGLLVQNQKVQRGI